MEEAFRVLETLEDSELAARDTGLVPGLQDELATVIRMTHGTRQADYGAARGAVWR